MKEPNRLHWLAYRLFRWIWNPILHSNPQMRRTLGVVLICYESEQDAKAREDDEKIVDALVKRRLGQQKDAAR